MESGKPVEFILATCVMVVSCRKIAGIMLDKYGIPRGYPVALIIDHDGRILSRFSDQWKNGPRSTPKKMVTG